MSSSSLRIKLERDEPGGDVDVARGRFDAALQGLLQKDEESDSEIESDDKSKAVFSKVGVQSGRTTRPPRKRRRKEVDLRDSGFHHTFVMRMFDRSVDLAQFELSSPLYPICRAWMINQPHNSSLNVKQEPESPENETYNNAVNTQEEEFVSEILPDGPLALVTKFPNPDPWPEDLTRSDPRIPEPLPRTESTLEVNSSDSSPMCVLLPEHLKRWRQIRNLWRNASKVNDLRYINTYNILKTMFDRAHEG